MTLPSPLRSSSAPGVSPFTVTKSVDRIMANVGAGVELLTLGGATLRMDYWGRFSSDVEAHALELRGASRSVGSQWLAATR